MSMFPGANAHVYRNEAGEPLGWDYPGHDDPYDPDDYLPGDIEDDEDDEDDEMEDRIHPLAPDGFEVERTWPDLDARCEDLIKEAFGVLNEAPGLRRKYADVQNKLAEAIRILRGQS